MRKWICAALTLCMLAALCGCSNLKESVNFYYTRHTDHIIYGDETGFICPEEREASGHSGDLSYLLALYLAGPLSEELVRPFPEGTRLENLVFHRNRIDIFLSEEFSQLSGIELTVACSCIAATCFDLSDVNEITVISSGTELFSRVRVTMTRGGVLLIDDNLPSGSTEVAE